MAVLLKRVSCCISLGKKWAPTSMVVCHKSNFPKNKQKKELRGKTFLSAGDSLTAKGYLRPQKAYVPRSDVPETIHRICEEVLGDTGNNSCSEPDVKFKILDACYQEFKHSVPNSLLCRIQNVDDIIKFYTTPVDVTLPLDAMKTVELPPNLHIQHEYVRFHPDTDTKFGGVSAFPKSSTIVTGLLYKKKYKGYKAKTSWP
ncbi:large ribosomal subunit protein mL50 [Anabrus simplex]|uniref:large ribosomal subunit protein mL50 n=1 Tax=Anabrus simplex TaxID=316456 RepID=UPI0034DD5F9C